MNGLSKKLTDFFGSRSFWCIVLGFFILEALWVVFSAVYPMPFDEDFHLGIIRLYAEQWSPFLSVHPAGADQFGAVARDPSYFYHYLMSFPYRAITALTGQEAMQIGVLRLINVGLFTSGLLLMRQVMLRAKASPAAAHVALAVFVLIPIVPQLAAHINYDNLVLVLVALLCLAVFSVAEGFRKQRINISALLSFIAVCLYMSIVKYAVLPFIVAALIFLIIMGRRHFRGQYQAVVPAFTQAWSRMRPLMRYCLVAFIAVGALLFMQRYAVNLVEYKTPVPDCGQVLSVDQCLAYGPWGRDYYFALDRPANFTPHPVSYMGEWLRGMWFRSFFAINGPASDFATRRPLPVPSITAIVLVSASLLAMVIWRRKIFRGHAYLLFFMLLAGLYVVILWFDQYGMYRRTGQPVAINGRYLLPILPLLAVVGLRALHMAFARLGIARLKGLIAGGAIILFLAGGGVTTFILRSDKSWYWPTPTAHNLNHAAQDALRPIIIEGRP